jgi:hypothetical protein
MSRRDVCDDRRNKLAAVVAVARCTSCCCVLRGGGKPLRGMMGGVVESGQPCMCILKLGVGVRP